MADEAERRRINARRAQEIGDPDDPPEEDKAREIPVAHHYEHPPLPITAPDFSYVMDLTDLRSLLGIFASARPGMEDVANAVEKVVTNVVNNNRVNHGYRYLLSIIDTTSRRAWMYPLKTKQATSVYVQFQKFLNDVHGKIARLLSDSDTAFAEIRKRNDNFTYCSIVADHNNHKTLGLIDRFTRTFRDLLYQYFRDHTHGRNYSWYLAYPIVLDTYNNSKHRELFLRGLPKTRHDDPGAKVKRFYYTPNQVWFNPRLRSRIRLRCYFDGYQNYLPGSLYDRIKHADRVRVRLLRKDLNHGSHAFSDVTYEKGMKRGNAWLVNGRWYTYRNLWPFNEHSSIDERAGVDAGDSEAMKVAKRRRYHSKYKFAKAQKRWLDIYDEENDFDDDDEPPPPPPKRRMKSRKGAKEIGELRRHITKHKSRDDVAMGMEYLDEIARDKGRRYNLRSRHK